MSRERIINQTKTLLKDSLLDLLSTKPLARITVKELCERADINRTTYYKYYIDIYDHMEKIENEIISNMLSEIDTITLENVNDTNTRLPVIKSSLEYINQHRQEFKILLENNELKFQLKLLSVIGKRIFNKLDWHNQEKAIHYIYIVNGSYGLIKEWLKGNIDLGTDALAKVIESYIEN